MIYACVREYHTAVYTATAMCIYIYIYIYTHTHIYIYTATAMCICCNCDVTQTMCATRRTSDTCWQTCTPSMPHLRATPSKFPAAYCTHACMLVCLLVSLLTPADLSRHLLTSRVPLRSTRDSAKLFRMLKPSLRTAAARYGYGRKLACVVLAPTFVCVCACVRGRERSLFQL